MRNLKFGVEIEFFNVNYQTVIEGLRADGIEVADFNGYTHAVISQWKVTTDGSVTGRNTGLHAGLELVSPILYEDEGLEELEKVYATLNRLGAKVDKTCGTHVHFDIADFTTKDTQNAVILYYNYQSILNSFLPPSRGDNQFCREIPGHTAKNIYGMATSISDISWELGTRYKVINLTSYVKYGTIEFRQHSGTLEFPKIEAWIVMLSQLLEKAKKSELLPVTRVRATDNNLKKFMRELDLEGTYVGDFLTARHIHFTTGRRIA